MQDDRSDVFILGLLFFYLLTNKKSPMSISPTDFEEDQMKYRVRVSMKHLDDLQAGNDSDIYLIALIKKMIQKDPQDRLTSNKLINHAAFIDSIEQIQITQRLYKKCYYFVEADNEALVKLLNEEKKHIEASLGAKSTELVQLQTRALVMSDKKIIVDWVSN